LNHTKGLCMVKRKDITLRDIAQQAHVSTATISRYLNHPEKISKNLRDTIDQIVNQMNYNLKKQKQSSQNISIGLLVPDISNPWFTLLIKSIENSANIMGFSIILADSNNDPSTEKSNFFRLIEKGIDGLIIIPTENNASYMHEYIDNNFPIIFLDRCINKQGVYYITSDNMQGAYQATKYLISLGHKSILYIGGNKLINTESERFSGYTSALSEANIKFDPELYISADYSFEKAKKAIFRLISKPFRFTAIFASDDMMAFGAKTALEEKGYKIPEDISLIGFDNILFSSLMSLTTISQPASEMGKNAIMLIDNILHKRNGFQNNIILPTNIIIRNSCKRIEN